MTTIPPALSFTWTTVLALRDLGGSGTVEEINDAVVAMRGLTEEQQAVPHSGDTRTEVAYRLAWARTLAKNIGLAVNTSRSVWVLTELGRVATEDQVEELKRKRAKDQAALRKKKSNADASAGVIAETEDDLDDAIEQEEQDWKAQLLEVLKEMDPSAFERLSKRLLREAGFEKVVVTGGTGDQGIDGSGVYRLSLVSFPVYFQCKRYKNPVGAGDVRNFRGAVSGRADRGLIITTSTFTPAAKAEAARAGVSPIDLIDGDALAELLREHGIGVESVERKVYDVTVHSEFFATI